MSRDFLELSFETWLLRMILKERAWQCLGVFIWGTALLFFLPIWWYLDLDILHVFFIFFTAASETSASELSLFPPSDSYSLYLSISACLCSGVYFFSLNGLLVFFSLVISSLFRIQKKWILKKKIQHPTVIQMGRAALNIWHSSLMLFLFGHLLFYRCWVRELEPIYLSYRTGT